MPRLVVELTNRCNLRCLHCFEDRHAGTGELPAAVIDALIADGHSCGIDHLCFTGGEPTIHPAFTDIVDRTRDAGYSFSFVSNGTRFERLLPLLVRCRDAFQGVTFSLDGARESTHDRLRGRGSFREVMRAASACVVRKFPFTFNMVLTDHNRDEIEKMASLAAQLGSRAVRFGHLMPPSTGGSMELHLTLAERRSVEARIWALAATSRLPIVMGPGHYSESPYFPCAPLEVEEFNVDYRGNLTLCCQLSGRDGHAHDGAIIGNLQAMRLAEACTQFRARVDRYLADKRARVERGAFRELDHFPCVYCVAYLEETTTPDSPRRLHVYSSRGRAAGS